jgi:hypothetical protein
MRLSFIIFISMDGVFLLAIVGKASPAVSRSGNGVTFAWLRLLVQGIWGFLGFFPSFVTKILTILWAG